MKLKGIWIAIGVIVIAGIGVTRYTRSYIESEQENSVMVQGQSLEVMPDAGVAEQGMDAENAKGAGETFASGGMAKVGAGANAQDSTENQEQSSSKRQSKKQAVSGAEKSGIAVREESADGAKPSDEVFVKLRAIDEEIAQRASGETDTTPNARKATVENECKLWETQMNRFLDTLENQLEPSEWEKLFKEQKEWLRTRDEEATKGSGRQNGSTLDEIEYNRLIRESTRQRTYELAERYGEVLSTTE